MVSTLIWFKCFLLDLMSIWLLIFVILWHQRKVIVHMMHVFCICLLLLLWILKQPIKENLFYCYYPKTNSAGNWTLVWLHLMSNDCYVLLLTLILIYCILNNWLRMKHMYFYIIFTIFFLIIMVCVYHKLVIIYIQIIYPNNISIIKNMWLKKIL